MFSVDGSRPESGDKPRGLLDPRDYVRFEVCLGLLGMPRFNAHGHQDSMHSDLLLRLGGEPRRSRTLAQSSGGLPAAFLLRGGASSNGTASGVSGDLSPIGID